MMKASQLIFQLTQSYSVYPELGYIIAWKGDKTENR